MEVLKYGDPFHYEVTCKRCHSILKIEPEEAFACGQVTCPICNCKLYPADSDKVYDTISVKTNISQECLQDTK